MRYFLITLVCFSCLPAAWGAGTITNLSGTLSVKRGDGSVRILSVKSEVLAGDTLQTQKDSYAQVKFLDGAEVTLKPNTQFVVEVYKFNAAKPAEDGAVFGLLKGGLRAVTGMIGKRGDQDAYQMKTSTATIGIRGTRYDADDCKTTACYKGANVSQGTPSVTGMSAGEGVLADAGPILAQNAASNDSREQHDAGVYVSVHDGEIVLSNGAGRINLAAGQFGFVAAGNIMPRVLPGDPGLGAIPAQSLVETITSQGRLVGQCD